MKIRFSILEVAIFVMGCGWLLCHLLPFNELTKSWWPFTITHFSSIVLLLPGIVVAVLAIAIPSAQLQVWVVGLKTKRAYYWLLCSISATILGALCFYAIPHKFFGDGNLVEALTGANVERTFGVGKQNIKSLITLLATVTGWSTENTFRILSVAGGLLYFGSLVILLKGIREKVNGILVLCILGMQPYILFFSNYIETYPLLAGLFALYLALAVELADSIKKHVVQAVVLIVLFLLHPVFAILVFGQFTLILFKTSIRKKVLPVFVISVLAGIAGYLMFSTAIRGPVFGGIFLPAFNNREQVYSMFSIDHGLDLIKYALFIFFPAIVVAVLAFRKNTFTQSKYIALLPFTVTMLIFLSLADFKLGAFDWDVFSTFAMPVLLLPLLVFVEREDSSNGTKILLFVFGISLARILPWLDINSNLEKAADYAITTAKFDSHQQLGTRVYSLSTRLREAGLKDRALQLSEKLNQKDGDQNVVARNNYAQSLIQSGRYDEALKILQEITTNFPDYFQGNANLGELYIEHFNQPDSAYTYLNKAIVQRPDAAYVVYALAFIDLRSGRINDAKVKFQRVVTLDPQHADAHAKLGMICLQQGEREEGIRKFDMAMKLGGIPVQTQEMICRSFAQMGLAEKARECEGRMKR